MKENLNEVRLSPHFKLSEFLNLGKYPENIPTKQAVVNMTYGCHQLLEPARLIVGPIIINSGFRNEVVNRQVGGVKNSQHLKGEAADITCADNKRLAEIIEQLGNFDQLIVYPTFLHVSYKRQGVNRESITGARPH